MSLNNSLKENNTLNNEPEITNISDISGAMKNKVEQIVNNSIIANDETYELRKKELGDEINNTISELIQKYS